MIEFLSKRFFYPTFQLKEGNYRILEKLKEIEYTYSRSRKYVENIRLEKLNNIISHAFKNCSFYKNWFHRYSFDINNIDFNTLKRLPVLTKTTINENREQIIASNFRKDILKDSTGGSTTQPLVFYRDKNCWLVRNAYQLYYNKLLGLDIGTKSALIWGARRDLPKREGYKSKIKKSLIFRKINLDATLMDKHSIDTFLHELIKFKPKIIYGYPSAINVIANKIKKREINVEFIKAIICTAEPLNSHYRNNISSVFDCQVYNRYTSREVGIIAQECRKFNGMHINSLSIHIEIRNNRIIITDLENYGMPLINYDIGDMTEDNILKCITCDCGSPTDILKLGASRDTDYFKLKDGTLVFGAGIPITAFTGETGIKNIQIVQKSFTDFEVKIVKDNEFSAENIKLIKNTFNAYIGKNIKFRIIYVDDIKRNKNSGKYQYIVSELAN